MSDGAVCVDGIDVRDATLGSLRANVGVVLDEPLLFSISIAENIAYGKPDATYDAIEAGGARGEPGTSSSSDSPRATTPWSENADTRSRAGNGSASP